VIVYLHCFNGSRIESCKFAEQVLRNGVAFCAFDFAGSGLSDGEYVSLGHFEQEDVEIVVADLRTEKRFTEIALWGRSMGAVTALLYA
jgi:alpha-beta hydrolase superfamily lysophospholipase